MERRQGFRNLDVFVFQVCISPTSHVIVNPNMTIKYHETSASQSSLFIYLFIYCLTGFNISFTIQQQATKISHKLYHKKCL